jgi:hypothetical protein
MPDGSADSLYKPRPVHTEALAIVSVAQTAFVAVP